MVVGHGRAACLVLDVRFGRAFFAGSGAGAGSRWFSTTCRRRRRFHHGSFPTLVQPLDGESLSLERSTLASVLVTVKILQKWASLRTPP
jgi:hypothetical protein